MLETLKAMDPAISDRGILSGNSRDPPLDLVHLARQCQGDHALEDELLGLFRLQARALAAQLSDALPVSDALLASLESKANIAHRLCGSALAVGALRVAGAARRIEQRASAARDRAPPSAEELAAVTQAIAALDATVAEAVAEIERIRRRGREQSSRE